MDLDCRQTCDDISSYKGILNALDIGVILYDPQGSMKLTNKVALSILPDLGEHLSKCSNLISFIFDHSLDYSEQNHLVSSSVQRDSSDIFNEIICINESRYYTVHMIEQDNRDIIVELIDISDIKNRTDSILSLDKDKRTLTKAIQSSEKGIFVAENRGNKEIVFTNRAINKFFDNRNYDWAGLPVEEFLSTQFAHDWGDIQKILDQSGQGYFWKTIDKNSTEKQWLRLNLFVESHGNQENLIISFISDETKNKMQENQLLQNQKLEALGKLSGGIAHDFNNILAIIDGYIRLSENALQRGETITENIVRIKQAVARGSGLTKQLLTFGKHRVKENELIDVCSQVKEIEVFLKPLLGAEISLKIEIMDSPCLVKSNTDSISQIIMNLVINSRDAMTEGGEITIRVRDNFKNGQTYVVLEIQDNGSGIPAEILSKIFDPFFTTKEQGKGTGLGLSMVYGVVQQLEGIIDVSSVIAQGTVFTIQIPMTQGEVMIDFVESVESPNSNLSGKTILVAEDEDDLLVIISMILEDWGMHVLKAKNGNEALAIQDEYDGHIDFLFTDIVMPELGGLKLAELIKEVRPETHILFMSGYPARGDACNINLPKNVFLMAKPIDPHALNKYLIKYLSGSDEILAPQATIWKN